MSYKGYPQGNDPYIKGRPADYPSIKTTYDRSNITDFNVSKSFSDTAVPDLIFCRAGVSSKISLMTFSTLCL